MGDRVLAESPTGAEDLQFGLDIIPADWRKLTLRAPKRNGTEAEVVLLRPLTWLNWIDKRWQEPKTEGRGDANVECGTSVPLSNAVKPPSRGNWLPVDSSSDSRTQKSKAAPPQVTAALRCRTPRSYTTSHFNSGQKRWQAPFTIRDEGVYQLREAGYLAEQREWEQFRESAKDMLNQAVQNLATLRIAAKTAFETGDAEMDRQRI